MHVTWQGPLVIRSVGELPAGTTPLRREITALGSPVVAESQDGTVRAATLIRDVNTGLTRLLGSEQHGVRMESGETMKRRCASWPVLSRTTSTYCVGPGAPNRTEAWSVVLKVAAAGQTSVNCRLASAGSIGCPCASASYSA